MHPLHYKPVKVFAGKRDAGYSSAKDRIPADCFDLGTLALDANSQDWDSASQPDRRDILQRGGLSYEAAKKLALQDFDELLPRFQKIVLKTPK